MAIIETGRVDGCPMRWSVTRACISCFRPNARALRSRVIPRRRARPIERFIACPGRRVKVLARDIDWLTGGGCHRESWSVGWAWASLWSLRAASTVAWLPRLRACFHEDAGRRRASSTRPGRAISFMGGMIDA